MIPVCGLASLGGILYESKASQRKLDQAGGVPIGSADIAAGGFSTRHETLLKIQLIKLNLMVSADCEAT